jgi:hypothetical protein
LSATITRVAAYPSQVAESDLMQGVPSVEDAALFVLSIFIERFNARAGHVLRLNSFIMPFASSPWQTSDFEAGARYAIQHGWIEPSQDRGGLKLTEAGFGKHGEVGLDLKRRCNEQITLEHKDGSRRENVPSLVTGEIVLVADESVPISPGDAILRQLPSGLVERLIVADPGFHARSRTTGAHYQIRYRREDQQPANSPGHVFNVTGPNARVNVNSIDNSSNLISYVSQNMEALSGEFTRLRDALVSKAQTAEEYAAIGTVAQAELAAKGGDPSKIDKALSALGAAGKWVFDTAKDIGVEIAAETLKKSLGF